MSQSVCVPVLSCAVQLSSKLLLSFLTQQPEERTRLHDELEEAKDKARRRSIGNIKFIGELFKLKMLTEAIMHDCVVKLLKNHDEESLECLCRLLTTIGKDLDFEKAKVKAHSLRSIQWGLGWDCQQKCSILPQWSGLLLFLLLPFALSVCGPRAPYHFSITGRSEEGPRLDEGQFGNCSDYLSLVHFLHDHFTGHFSV